MDLWFAGIDAIYIYIYQGLQLHQVKLQEHFAGARWYLLQLAWVRVPA
jgi:hypothetical protein